LFDENDLTWISPAPDPPATFSTDGAKPIEIRATLPSGSKLKPIAPDGR
jgi:hypothetical protein